MFTSICSRPMLILLGAAVVAVVADRCVVPMLCNKKPGWVEMSSDQNKNAENAMTHRYQNELRNLQARIGNIDETIEKQKARLEEYKKTLATSPSGPTTAPDISPGFTYGPRTTICPSTDQPITTKATTAAEGSVAVTATSKTSDVVSTVKLTTPPLSTVSDEPTKIMVENASSKTSDVGSTVKQTTPPFSTASEKTTEETVAASAPSKTSDVVTTVKLTTPPLSTVYDGPTTPTAVLTAKDAKSSAVSSSAESSGMVTTAKQTLTPLATVDEETASSAPIEIITCETELFDISCPSGQKIKIIYANYGRTSKIVCLTPYGTYHTECFSDASQTIVKNKCEGEEACKFRVNNVMFGDPCMYVYKYLQVQYKCILKTA